MRSLSASAFHTDTNILSFFTQYLEEQEEEEEEEEEDEEQQWKYAYGEEPEVVGARGEGCQSNYGEYMSEYPCCVVLILSSLCIS